MKRWLSLFFLMWQYCYAQPVEITFWHAMAGSYGAVVVQQAHEFNNKQDKYRIIPVYKGGYAENLTNYIAAFRAHKQPEMVHIFDIGSAVMRSTPGVTIPVGYLFEKYHVHWSKKDLFQAPLSLYSDENTLYAFPYNVSIPLMYYNLDALAAAGVQRLPEDWSAFAVMLARLRAKGFRCVYTSAYPSWILIEDYAVQHHMSLLRNLNVAQIQLWTQHLQRLKDW